PGNSGGPLINMAGEVVGVNSAIRSATGVNSGVGFSIPVNAVRRIVPSLIANGNYTYSYMGVRVQSLNLNLQEELGLAQVTGAYLVDVTPGSPAEEAGLIPGDASDGRGGDLIVAIDDQPVRDTEELIAYLVFNTEVGQSIELTVVRDGETITVPVTLGARP
ncbi:MAG: S1C family serine protease, partial [Dongiaceae bacterium]